MVKLLICLISALVLAAVVVQLRQQRLELAYECTKLHNQIEEAQIQLWNQQFKIATYTTPSEIQKTVKQYDLSLVPSKPFMPVDGEGLTKDAE